MSKHTRNAHIKINKIIIAHILRLVNFDDWIFVIRYSAYYSFTWIESSQQIYKKPTSTAFPLSLPLEIPGSSF